LVFSADSHICLLAVKVGFMVGLIISARGQMLTFRLSTKQTFERPLNSETCLMANSHNSAFAVIRTAG
jgi:hypothetical protein